MHDMIYTLQDYMTHTEAVTYIILAAVLVGFLGFWRFLGARDED